MNKKKLIGIVVGMIAAALLVAQQVERIIITGGQRARIAVPDLRGSGEAQQYMNAFNQTLWSDLENAGIFDMASKSMYWTHVPQQPSDFRPQPAIAARSRTSPNTAANGQGLWLSDWAAPPVSAKYLVFGYTGAESGQIVLRGWMYDVTKDNAGSAQLLGKIYLGPLNEEGAKKVAHDFATDILQQFGQKGIANTKIYYVSQMQRGIKEIWSMDPDGSNQKQITHFKSLSFGAAISPDNTKMAFCTYAHGNPNISLLSLETGRRLPFYNETSPMVASPEFTPDGNQILFSSSVGGFAQIFIANANGSGMRRLAYARAVETEPKVNPKTGNEIAFVSGRSGPPQIFRMTIEGADVQRLTEGNGEAVNPAWRPDGQFLAFAWTRGYAPGNYNIFIMDVPTRRYVQLTHGAGRNEMPSWAPDGRHLVFASNRSGSSQIWTMLADGTQLQQLTTRGVNERPVWSK